MTSLPSWLEAELPAPVEPHVLSMAEGVLTVTAPDGTVETYADLKAVRDAKGSTDLKILPEVYAAHGDESMDDFALFFPVSEHFSGMLMSHTDEDRRASLERDFAYALECAQAHAEDPKDFLKAYNFIDHHPAFWTRHSGWHWATSGHCERLSHYVGLSDGQVVIGFETGAHVPDETPHGGPAAYTHHYHDYRLDVYAPTFEDAYIALAAKVATFFHPDGTEIEGVDHEKPEWVEIVEERAEEARKWAAEEALGEA